MGNMCNKSFQNENEPLINGSEISDSSNQSKLCEKDFTKIRLIGRGSYGNVYLVRYIKNNHVYAMKVYSKSDLREKNQEDNTKSERNLQTQINFPFIVSVKFAFQTESKLFLVQEFIQGGDLFNQIHSNPKFSTEKTRFYSAEIIIAIEYLHNNNMIYRDLKPENILIGLDGHIKITDFGLSKKYNKIEKAFTICGTLQYIAPEILEGSGYNESVDWWSLGVIMFEMITSKLPFRIKQDSQPNPDIYKKNIIYPTWMDETAKDLINKLLNINPLLRIGSGINGCDDIKKHEFFKDIDWNKALNKKLKPPFIPKVEDETDIKYFEKSLMESPIFSENSEILVNEEENEEDNNKYDGFTFVAVSYNELKDCKEDKDDI